MILEIKDLDSLPRAVKSFLPFLKDYKIVLLNGEMGNGKTTFVQEVLRQMGVSDSLEGSPTYSLVNEYFNASFGKIFHLDLFRLKSEEEAYDIGIEEIMDGKNYCFIEWPEKIQDFVQDPYIEINFSVQENGTRILEVIKKPA